MQYACLVYFDPRKVFDQSPESSAVLAAVGPHDEALRASGRMVAAQALTLPSEAITVRVRDLNEAVTVAAGMPFARLGGIEVRPVVDHGKPRPTL